jgi:hypothetical protein
VTDPAATLPEGYEPAEGEYHVTIIYDPVTNRQHPWLVETYVYSGTRGWCLPTINVSEGSVLYPRAREQWKQAQPTRFGSPRDAVRHRHKVLEPYETQLLLDTVRRKQEVAVTLPR